MIQGRAIFLSVCLHLSSSLRPRTICGCDAILKGSLGVLYPTREKGAIRTELPSLGRIVGFVVIVVGLLMLLGGIGLLLYQVSWRLGHPAYQYSGAFFGDLLIASFPMGIGAIVLVAGVWLARRGSRS